MSISHSDSPCLWWCGDVNKNVVSSLFLYVSSCGCSFSEKFLRCLTLLLLHSVTQLHGTHRYAMDGVVNVCMWPQMKPNVFCMTHIFSRFCTALCCRCVVGFSTATLLRGFHECEWILRNLYIYWWDTLFFLKVDNMVFLVLLNSQLTLVDKNSKLD